MACYCGQATYSGQHGNYVHSVLERGQAAGHAT